MIRLFKNKTGKVQILLVSLVWLLIFLTPLLFGNFKYGVNWDHIFRIWRDHAVLFVIFLTNRFVLMPHLFLNGKRRSYFIAITSIIVLYSVSLYFMEMGHRKKHPHKRPHHIHRLEPQKMKHSKHFRGPREFIPPYAQLLIMSILVIGFDSGLLFFTKWTKSEQNKLEAEKESTKNKLAFLQNQISPHFLMNTLNNIHSLIDINTEDAKESVIKLSNMMDYMLYESQTNYILLQKEIGFMSSYVDLMRIRYIDDVDIKFEIPTTIPQVRIPPLLTISFIENAFKYGISYEVASFIHINIDITKTHFYFKVKNSLHLAQYNKKHSGIGIKNARTRLDLIYNTNYELIINEKNNSTFEVNLTVPL